MNQSSLVLQLSHSLHMTMELVGYTGTRLLTNAFAAEPKQ